MAVLAWSAVPTAAEARVAHRDTFSFDISGFNGTSGTGTLLTPQLTVYFGVTQTFAGVGANGQDITITSSEAFSADGHTTTDTFTISTPTNFVTSTSVNGITISELQFDLGAANSGSDIVSLEVPINSYTSAGNALFGTSNTSISLTPTVTLGSGNYSYSATEAVNTGTTPITSSAIHSFTFSITYTNTVITNHFPNNLWTGAAGDSLWNTPGNWTLEGPALNGYPGMYVSYFAGAGNGDTSISLGTGGVTPTVKFDDVSPNDNGTPSYTIGAGSSETLSLVTGGGYGLVGNGAGYDSISVIKKSLVKTDQTVNATARLGTDAGSGTYIVYAEADFYHPVGTLSLTGPILGGTGGSAGPKTLALVPESGDYPAAISVSGAIGDGGATLLSMVVNGPVTVSGVLTYVGGGLTTLSGTNTFTGPLSVPSGTLTIPVVNNASTAGPLGNSATAAVLGGASSTGTLEYTGATASSNKPFAMGSGGVGNFVVDNAAATLTLSGVVSGTGGLTNSGPGRLALAGANTFTGPLSVINDTLSVPVVNNANAAGPLGNSAAAVVLGGASSTGTLEYTGATASSNKPFTLAASGVGNFVVDNAAVTLTLSGAVGGAGGLTKNGPGTLVLAAFNTYTGATTVSAGTLSVAVSNLSLAAAVNLTSGSTLNLAFTGANAVKQLTIDGVVQSSGTWGGLSSTATYRTPLITGPGTLSPATGATTQPYASWAASYALPKSGFYQDADGDGISNGLEWILGGNPTVPSLSVRPQTTYSASQVTLAFTRLDASESQSSLYVDWSADLVTWTSAPIGAASSTTAQGIVITVVENGTSPDSVTVAVPRSLGTNGRLFVRLRATLN